MENNHQVYLEIRDLDSLISFLTEVKAKTGMLKDVSLAEVKHYMGRMEFPIKFEVSLDGVLKLCENPVLRKMFGKKIEESTKLYLKALKTG